MSGVTVVFDAAAPTVGVAVESGGVVRSRGARADRGAEGLLLEWVVELLGELGRPMSDVSGVGATAGPGAFTGLRVGLATAAGLASALDVPLWTIDSLTPRAAAVSGGRVLVVLDARKGRVYAGQWLDGERVEGPVDEALDAVLARCPAPFVATGEGAEVFRDAILAAGGTIAREPRDAPVDSLAALAAAALARGEGRSALEVHPLYLREADAKLPGTEKRVWNDR